jgi:hypothetical protein
VNAEGGQALIRIYFVSFVRFVALRVLPSARLAVAVLGLGRGPLVDSYTGICGNNDHL